MRWNGAVEDLPRGIGPITGRGAECEQWTQVAFPPSGAHWFPGGLATVAIDRDSDSGTDWEPNVRMHHTI